MLKNRAYIKVMQMKFVHHDQEGIFDLCCKTSETKEREIQF